MHWGDIIFLTWRKRGQAAGKTQINGIEGINLGTRSYKISPVYYIYWGKKKKTTTTTAKQNKVKYHTKFCTFWKTSVYSTCNFLNGLSVPKNKNNILFSVTGQFTNQRSLVFFNRRDRRQSFFQRTGNTVQCKIIGLVNEIRSLQIILFTEKDRILP